MAEFTSDNDYWKFSQSVIRRARYVFEPDVNDFLEAVMSTVSNRIFVIEPDSILHRAQLGFEWRIERVVSDDPNSDTIEIEDALPSERMKPLRDSAREGRINPKGIPCLYLSDEEKTAMAETRPWIGSFVSLAHFVVLKTLRLVNCSEPRKRFSYIFRERHKPLTPSEREEIAWGEISYAFSEPVTPTDLTAEYAPTQVLSDLFRHHGYDGIRYKSLLGDGFNYALFDLDAAEVYSGQLHMVKTVRFEFDTHNNPYTAKKYYEFFRQRQHKES
jgi:hypothetical protein